MKNVYLKKLVERLVAIKDLNEMEKFLSALLTPQEFKAIPLRLEIVRLLKEGVPQREIVKRIGVGVATVTRGSRELKLKHFKNV